ncbi:hypothetical protein C8F04DRAFT_17369 [Mycena alexandri]|uniref:Uncharacterized protein n=1 Tax=Mycena alexandri TaxID=1745969 RepID=A0AAD6XF37_9AGAR|nr:hypothetical protein C8F04DRAFT_17369 [Mycena alexandri]
MFSNIHSMLPTAAEIASQTLIEEGSCRFPAFSSSDAVTLGLSIRKRFRSTSRHRQGKGLVISIQTIAGHPLFSCSVGDLGHLSGIGDISLDSWSAVEGMVNVVKRTGHSSYYVEKGMAAMGKTPKQMGLQGEFRVNGGGTERLLHTCDEHAELVSQAFPIWLENAPCCPIAIVACYSGSSQDDHRVRTMLSLPAHMPRNIVKLVATTVRDYLKRLSKHTSSPTGPTVPTPTTENPQAFDEVRTT